MSVRSEVARLRRAIASIPADWTDERAAWADVFGDDPDAFARQLKRGRLIALDTHTGRMWVAEHRRLGLPDPTEVPHDVCEKLLSMIARPTHSPTED